MIDTSIIAFPKPGVFAFSLIRGIVSPKITFIIYTPKINLYKLIRWGLVLLWSFLYTYIYLYLSGERRRWFFNQVCLVLRLRIPPPLPHYGSSFPQKKRLLRLLLFFCFCFFFIVFFSEFRDINSELRDIKSESRFIKSQLWDKNSQFWLFSQNCLANNLANTSYIIRIAWYTLAIAS